MLHTLTQEALETLVWDKFFSENPHLKRGENMVGPVAICSDGKLHTPRMDEEVSKDQVVSASSWKVKYAADGSLPSLEVSSKRGWVYPYQVIHRFHGADNEAFTKNIGDEITVPDPLTFLPKKVQLTQEMVDDMRFIIIRAGFSE